MLRSELLARVQGPARYIGTEYNMVVKDPSGVTVRVALCYPDVYEVGMSHVGSQILYHTINRRDDAYCERAFHPHPDAADLMRENGMRLTALESGDPLRDFDVVGITLQHELTYTTILSLLELGGIELLAAERPDDAPLVLGGGPCAYNPEPVAAFFDAFVIGDGEEAVHDVLEAVAEVRGQGRRRLWERLAEVAGVYVPQVHDPATARVRRRVLQDLDAADYPTRPIVPYVEVVHDRGQIEVARGCTRGCRFCQAGMIYRPVRERKPETLRRQAREIIAQTGYDEISLVSLNCPDYTAITELVDGLNSDLGQQRVSVGLPSLRIDSFSVGLARKVQQVRKSGLTFAPEAGSQRLRDAINKGVTEQDLVEATGAAFEAGWHTIKLYFMIGLPTETDDDVRAIADLVKTVARVGRETLGSRAGRMKLNVSVSTFVPKAHTPLQWDRQVAPEVIRRRQELLRDAIRDRQVSLQCHHSDQSVVEAALARGGRRTADAVQEAYRLGASLGDWSDRLDYERWEQAFAVAGLNLVEEAGRRFGADERLPWEHIDCGVSREFLLAERERVLTEALTPDCRIEGCAGCGVNATVACPLVAPAVVG